MHAASRHGTPSLTSLAKDGEVNGEVRPPRSPIQSLTSLESPDENCISHSATRPFDPDCLISNILYSSGRAQVNFKTCLTKICYSDLEL